MVEVVGGGGKNEFKKPMLCIYNEEDKVRHWICRNCVAKAEVIEILNANLDEEIQLAGSFELQNGEVVCTLPDLGFDYIDGVHSEEN